jgi:thioesterase domain-containing protein
MIGGWSAGSIYAYEICYQLAQQGEIISGLLLIDMMVPRPVVGAMQITMALVEQAGLFTGVRRASSSLRGLADIQKSHIVSTVRALAQYDPVPFPAGKEPLYTHLFWATRGLNDSANFDEHDNGLCGAASICSTDYPTNMSITLQDFATWLKSLIHTSRTDFGANGWDQLVGDKIQVSTVESDHFSIISPPAAKQLGAAILNAVAMVTDLEMEQKA